MRTKVLLGLVFLIFLITRLYGIGSIPPSVYWDEASIGYNAYSIGTDLKDEWGNFLPIHFRAFGEFKLPVYIYSVVPFVKVFGLNATAVRLPAVLYSLGILFVIYLLTKKITGKDWVAVLSSFILSVSPWLFIFSRTGYEATAGLFFFLLGTYLVIDNWNILLGMLSFILSFYSYNSFRVIIPAWLVVLLIYRFHDFKILKKDWIWLLVSLLIFLASLVPVYRLYKYDSGGTRFAQVEIKNASDFVGNYVSHFSPNFLFLNGDTNPRSQIPGHGELFWIDLPLVLLGLFAVIKSKKILYFIPVAMLLLAPIPAALTKESPHALRSLLAAPSYAIIAALGVKFVNENLKKFSTIFIVLIVAAYYLSFENYGYDFAIKYSAETANDWQDQYKQIFMNQKSGVVTDKYGQPYIFALFYQKVPPAEFRSTVKYNPVDKWGQSLVASFNGYQFK